MGTEQNSAVTLPKRFESLTTNDSRVKHIVIDTIRKSNFIGEIKRIFRNEDITENDKLFFVANTIPCFFDYVIKELENEDIILLKITAGR